MFRFSLAVLVLGTAHASKVESHTANQRAMAWLQEHRGESDPDAAGMNDLKSSDPNAFAIVQALLTKRSLGLLDPSNPTAAFGGPAHQKQRSFKQEAEEAGVSTEATASSSISAVPYPSAPKSVALPFPDMASEKDTQFGFHPNNDDAMVQSVLGAVDELKTHGSAFATKKSTTKVAADPGATPISLDWGNPHAGVDGPVSSHQSLVVSQSRSSDQSSMAASSGYGTARFDADASALGQEMVVQDENAHNSVASVNHHAPIVTPSLDWNSHTGPETQVSSQMSMGQQNAYLAAAPMTQYQTQYQSADPVQAMETSSFHKLADSFRKFSKASSLGESSARVTQTAEQDLGSNYNKDLQAAKNDQWKMALESTEWGKSSAPFQAIAQVQEDFDDSDGVDPVQEEQTRQQKINKFLGPPKQYAHYAPRAAMTQESEEDENDGGAKFAVWIGSKNAKAFAKSYDNVMPKNQYLNSYMADLTK
jgi:hypothetical protein